eukprot:519509-Amphidinium_carterae.1
MTHSIQGLGCWDGHAQQSSAVNGLRRPTLHIRFKMGILSCSLPLMSHSDACNTSARKSLSNTMLSPDSCERERKQSCCHLACATSRWP